MKKIKSSILFLSFASFLLLISCHKEGTGGKSMVNGYVKHHNSIIPNCVVYIKYGATEFPGTNTANYDASVTADANGRYEFSGLRKGNYYLYGLGYDNSISEVVKGGISVKLKYNKINTIDVLVTE